MRILDRYFLGNFLKTLLFALFVFLSIFVILDLIEKLKTYVANQVPFDIVLNYYFYAFPNIIVLMFPIAMLLAALYTTGQFVKNGEMTAIKAAGVSLYRVFTPVLIISVFISIFVFWFGEKYVPAAEKNKDDIWEYEVRKRTRGRFDRNSRISFQETNNRYVRLFEYDAFKKRGLGFNIITNDKNRIVKNIYADTLYYDTGKWFLHSVISRDFSNGNEVLEKIDKMELTDVVFTEEDLLNKKIETDFMNREELKVFMDKLKLMGNPYEMYNVDYVHKLAFPFVNFIVVLIGLSLATNKWGGGAAIGFGLCLLITFLYYVFMTFLEAIGYKGLISPILAGWLTNIIFGSFGLFTLLRAPK